jgi:hypothetical protein
MGSGNPYIVSSSYAPKPPYILGAQFCRISGRRRRRRRRRKVYSLWSRQADHPRRGPRSQNVHADTVHVYPANNADRMGRDKQRT